MTVFEIKATDRTKHYLFVEYRYLEYAQIRLCITAKQREKCTIILFLR